MKDTDTQQFIADLDGGVFEQKLGHALSLVAAHVVDHQRKGKVNITMDIKHVGHGAQVQIDHALKFEHPTLRGSVSEDEKTTTPMHVGKGGSLSFFPEDQGQLLGKQGQPAEKPYPND